ncbi:2-amino-4-hydroxy-6-hydroxymethyldihydropteridine diphosphokinase [Bifidobacterium sp. MA2]|uniref:2-amino-4-hydroxy-6-hydroxymethyldihydropteridine diphosphokinase n=1 Tax=Bifidobacterium santillanense TaxID=2809028 RepID=A0ABS5UNH9_9BIFI|nr:2-amino-4-hydroxy-6-hydroxymethyldihydropteridine diphosphokinase [Bifidobacterium santillanense]
MDSAHDAYDVVRLTGVRAGDADRFRADVTLRVAYAGRGRADDGPFGSEPAVDGASAPVIPWNRIARTIADAIGGASVECGGDGADADDGSVNGADIHGLARDVADRLLAISDGTDAVRAVEVTVRDLRPDVGVPCEGVSVTVTRVRETDDASRTRAEDNGTAAPEADDAIAGRPDAAEPPSTDDVPDGAATHRHAVISMDSTSTDAERLFRESIVALEGVPGTQVEGISPLYHVSNFDGPDAMAAVIQIETTMGARALIGALGTIERSLDGTIDLDLIDMDGVALDEPDCRVPWPSAREHAAVLAPWMDMDPNATLGGDPVSFLLAMAPDAARVGLLSDNWILGGTV